MIRQTKKFTPRVAAVFLAGLCSLAYFTSYVSRYTFTVCVSELTSPEVGLITDSDAGLICMMLFIFYGLGQLMSGMLGDRVRAEYLVCIGIAGAEACNLILPFIIGSPAAVAGLKVYELITEVNGEKVTGAKDFAAKIKDKKDLVFAVRRLSQTRMVKFHVK